MEAAARIARFVDTLMNLVVGILLLLVLLFGCYALWDTYVVFNEAAVDEAILMYKPELKSSDGTNPTLSELAKLNPDIRAWLSVDDTTIDYPVVQYTDNVKYLNTDAYGEFSLSGSIFLDCTCAADFSDYFSLLYGHHMEHEKMFGALDKFFDKDYFNKHSSGILYLADKTYRIEFFALLSVDAYDRYIFSPSTTTADEGEAFLKHIKDNAKNYRDIDISAEDQIIALSTCADSETNGRTVLCGSLTRMSFSEQGADDKTQSK